jgi:hypothetical protein
MDECVHFLAERELIEILDHLEEIVKGGIDSEART